MQDDKPGFSTKLCHLILQSAIISTRLCYTSHVPLNKRVDQAAEDHILELSGDDLRTEILGSYPGSWGWGPGIRNFNEHSTAAPAV